MLLDYAYLGFSVTELYGAVELNADKAQAELCVYLPFAFPISAGILEMFQNSADLETLLLSENV